MKRFKLGLAIAFCLALTGLPMVWLDDYVAALTITLNPTDDSYVNVNNPNTNYDGPANDQDLEISATATGFPSGTPRDIGYLRFDVSEVSVASCQTVTLRVYNQIGASPSVVMGLYSTDDDWNGAGAGNGDETTLTYNNAPAEVTLLDSQSGTGSAGWMVFDGTALTTYVRDQLPGNGGDGLVTLRLKVTSTGMADLNSFEDRENNGGTGNLPELVITSPTAVTLVSFTATDYPDYVLVAWETATEVDTVGFNLQRGGAKDGPFSQVNPSMILSQESGSILGAAYTYTDSTVGSGAYWYRLEVVGVRNSELTESIQVTHHANRIYLPLILCSDW